MRWILSVGRCQHHVQNHVTSEGALERQRAYRLSTSPLVGQSRPSWCRRKRKDLTWCRRTRKRSDKDPAPKIFVTPGQKAEASRGRRPITHTHTVSLSQPHIHQSPNEAHHHLLKTKHTQQLPTAARDVTMHLSHKASKRHVWLVGALSSPLSDQHNMSAL
jgi:hypothetical protein